MGSFVLTSRSLVSTLPLILPIVSGVEQSVAKEKGIVATPVLKTNLKVWPRAIRTVEGEREQQDERVVGSQQKGSLCPKFSLSVSQAPHTVTKFKFILLAARRSIN